MLKKKPTAPGSEKETKTKKREEPYDCASGRDGQEDFKREKLNSKVPLHQSRNYMGYPLIQIGMVERKKEKCIQKRGRHEESAGVCSNGGLGLKGGNC